MKSLVTRNLSLQRGVTRYKSLFELGATSNYNLDVK